MYAQPFPSRTAWNIMPAGTRRRSSTRSAAGRAGRSFALGATRQPTRTTSMRSAFATTKAAIQNDVANGRGGLRISIIFAAGNARSSGDNVNYNNLQKGSLRDHGRGHRQLRSRRKLQFPRSRAARLGTGHCQDGRPRRSGRPYHWRLHQLVSTASWR